MASLVCAVCGSKFQSSNSRVPKTCSKACKVKLAAASSRCSSRPVICRWGWEQCQ